PSSPKSSREVSSTRSSGELERAAAEAASAELIWTRSTASLAREGGAAGTELASGWARTRSVVCSSWVRSGLREPAEAGSSSSASISSTSSMMRSSSRSSSTSSASTTGDDAADGADATSSNSISRLGSAGRTGGIERGGGGAPGSGGGGGA